MHVLAVLRPELNDGRLRALVHASIGAIQSVLFYESGLSRPELEAMATSVAEAALFA